MQGHKRQKNPEPCETTCFATLSHLELYRTIVTIHRNGSYTTSYLIPIVMGLGLFLEVTYNYMVVKLYGKIPFLLYLSILGLSVAMVIIICVEIPQAGDCHIRKLQMFTVSFRILK